LVQKKSIINLDQPSIDFASAGPGFARAQKGVTS